MDVLLVFVLSGYFALVLALIVGMIAVEWILFERAGEPGWKVLIPFYDSFILHKIAFGEESKWYWFLLLIPGYGIYMRYAFTKTYGYSTGMAVLSVFFPYDSVHRDGSATCRIQRSNDPYLQAIVSGRILLLFHVRYSGHFVYFPL